MRAREPDRSGTLDVDGVTIAYETFGDEGPVVVLMPTLCIVPSRIWKFQVPYLSRHFRVVTWDGPGNGGSSRPREPAAYTAPAHVRYALAVLDALGVERATAVASSGGTHRTLLLAAEHPDRVEALAFIGPKCHLAQARPKAVSDAFASGDLERFLDVFMHHAFTEPHSSKALEDGMAWGRGTTLEILGAAMIADEPADLSAYRSMCAAVDQPVLVIQGDADGLTPPSHGQALVDAIGANAAQVVIEGGGHRGDVRDPVRVALLLRDLVRGAAGGPRGEQTRWHRAAGRPRRALFLSSPIGLGHVRRDLAIAREVRNLQPDLEIEWLAQDPVTRALSAAGERIHPASRALAGESAHFTGESVGHGLHAFQAWRRMDEILVANFMVLHDVLESGHYDLVVGDEAWEADHFLHENPELKRGAFVWLTDFVGWLPTDDGDPDDAALAADYNAEMVEQVARYPWVRDRSLFVGNPGDIVPGALGPGLPEIRDWTEAHFEFTGYITGFTDAPVDGDALRAQLGVEQGQRLCLATVGGSGIGSTLLHAVVDAFPLVRERRPETRLVVVTGPRIDPASLGAVGDGISVTGYLPDLHAHLAACDLAIVQGGLTTAMELTAHGRPFLYFPLARHFEQQIHVPYRLDRYKAGRRMDLAASDREQIAAAIIEELDRECDYVPVERDGAARAARMISELL